MRLLLTITGIALLAGCALTPDPVLKAGTMTAQGLVVLKDNVNAVIDGYDEKLRAAYRQGLEAAFEAERAKLIGPDGKIDIAKYEQLAAMLAARMDANEAWLDQERDAVKNKIAIQFATIQTLQSKVNAYNKAAGIPPESLALLLRTTEEIATEIAKDDAKEGQQQPSLADIVTNIGRSAYQRYMNQQAEGTATDAE